MGHHDIAFSVESKKQPAGYMFETTSYSECQLIYVTAGRLLFRGKESDNEVAIEPHGYALLRPGGTFRISCNDTGYGGFGVFARGDYPPELCGMPVTGLADSTVRMLGGMIQRHIAAPVAESRATLGGLGQALVWEVLTLARERGGRPERDWAAAVRTALELNLGRAMPVREVLASIPLSTRQLGRYFRERYGTSPKAYQALLRIDEARRMLRSTELDITTIATELGYSSSQHLASRFRRLVGCTPSAYRQQQGAT